MTELMLEQWKARSPDWRGRIQKRLRWVSWFKWRYEYGRYCYIVSVIEGNQDIVWWEWESDTKYARSTP